MFCLVVEVIEEKEKKKRAFVSVALVEKWVLVFACSQSWEFEKKVKEIYFTVAILNVRVIVEAFVLLVISRCSVWRMHN